MEPSLATLLSLYWHREYENAWRILLDQEKDKTQILQQVLQHLPTDNAVLRYAEDFGDNRLVILFSRDSENMGSLHTEFNLLLTLVETHATSLLTSEGGEGEYKLNPFRNPNIKVITRELSQRFFDISNFSDHPESLVGMISNSPVLVWGIEDRSLYLQTRTAGARGDSDYGDLLRKRVSILFENLLAKMQEKAIDVATVSVTAYNFDEGHEWLKEHKISHIGVWCLSSGETHHGWYDEQQRNNISRNAEKNLSIIVKAYKKSIKRDPRLDAKQRRKILRKLYEDLIEAGITKQNVAATRALPWLTLLIPMLAHLLRGFSSPLLGDSWLEFILLLCIIGGLFLAVWTHGPQGLERIPAESGIVMAGFLALVLGIVVIPDLSRIFEKSLLGQVQSFLLGISSIVLATGVLGGITKRKPLVDDALIFSFCSIAVTFTLLTTTSIAHQLSIRLISTWLIVFTAVLAILLVGAAAVICVVLIDSIAKLNLESPKRFFQIIFIISVLLGILHGNILFGLASCLCYFLARSLATLLQQNLSEDYPVLFDIGIIFALLLPYFVLTWVYFLS